MFSVSGRVVAAESGIGIPDLLVEFSNSGASDSSRVVPRRWGAVSTDADGGFILTFDPVGDDASAKPSIDLSVSVSAPEVAGRAAAPLFASASPRRNAARSETYVIRIPEAMLKEAGVDIHSQVAVPSAEISAKSIIERAKRDAVLAQAHVDADKIRFEAARAPIDAIRKEFLPDFARQLSRVSEEQAASDTFVADEDQITERQNGVFETDLKLRINNREGRAAIRTRFALTDEELTKVKAGFDGQNSISHEDLMAILGRDAEDQSDPSRINLDPLNNFCRNISEREREAAGALGIDLPAPDPEGPGEPSNPPDVTGDGVERIETGDIPTYLARLTDTMTSPEESVLAGLEPRATQGSVARQVNTFKLEPSPADQTAYYQFHNLEIAFRHVWQEAIDEGILTLAEAAYNEIVLAGGTPTKDSKRPIRALLDDARTLSLARTKSAATDHSATAKRGWWDITGGIRDQFADINQAVQLTPILGQLQSSILGELEQRLREEYAFTTFAASKKRRSVNFGALVTYQQEWKPLAYQAGRLAKTITLAPRETQRYSKTVKRSRKRSEKEVERHLSIRREELSQTSRSEQEIIRKANTKTNFEMNSEQTSKDPTGSAEATTKTSFGREASAASESTKRNFHESVMRAAQEFTDEVSTEINSEETEEFQLVESGEISNPNDELAVTFLFYELQRCYQICERIYRISPVVLVAQEMPKPNEIDEAWLVSHDWILRRVLLDDSFAPALSYLSERIVGDGVALGEMRTNIAQQRLILAELKRELAIVRTRVASYRSMLEKALLSRPARSGSGGGFLSGIPVVGDAIDLASDAIDAVGDFLNPDIPNVGESRQDALKDIIQRTADEERDLIMRVEREVTALNALTETYAKALAENYNHRMQVLRLRAHVKQNILYYMHAIWNHEPPDQRYLRLHEVPVPTFGGKKRYRFADLSPKPGMLNAFAHRIVGLDVRPPTHVFEAEVLPDFAIRETEPLAKVADLHNLRGYFGNCMIFDLKKSNPLTDFMMEPYVLQGFDELTDPDEMGNFSLDEFVNYVRCLKKALSEEQFEKVREQLRAQYDKLIKARRRDGDRITVPTGSLFIEALPATNSLVERYKAIHRSIDVKRAQAEVRQREIENLRLVDRLLNGERDDPDIDKKVVIQGAVQPDLPVDDPD